MFVGHLGVALAAKRTRPDMSLGWYIAATTALDLLWPIFLLLGIEHVAVAPGAMRFNPLVFVSYPWSHSLLMAVVWGVAFAGLARWRGASRDTAALLGAVVVSHWFLDLVVHAPDLPLWPGATRKFGFGLWNSVTGTLVVEGAIWVVGIALYLAPRRRIDLAGALIFWSLVIVTTAMWIGGPWSPPPSGQHALALFALVGWIMIPWAAWADRHYEMRGDGGEGGE